MDKLDGTIAVGPLDLCEQRCAFEVFVFKWESRQPDQGGKLKNSWELDLDNCPVERMKPLGDSTKQNYFT